MACLAVVEDSRPQQMADVGGQAVDLAFVAVESEGVAAAIVYPEVAAEVVAEVAGTLLEPLCEHAVAPDLASQPRAAPLCVVNVARDLTGSDRSLREPPVGELDCVPAVFPALVDQARRSLRLAR